MRKSAGDTDELIAAAASSSVRYIVWLPAAALSGILPPICFVYLPRLFKTESHHQYYVRHIVDSLARSVLEIPVCLAVRHLMNCDHQAAVS